VQSRYEHLVVAMLVPALGVSVDAIMQRRRWLTIPLVALLLAGVPGNMLALADYTHTTGAKSLVAYRRMMLTLPRIPVAREVPRAVVPESTSGFRVTIGWLLDGAASGRIPAPGKPNAAERAIGTVRLSVQQRRWPVPRRVCRPVDAGLVVSLAPGEAIGVAGAVDRVRLQPAAGNARGTYPLLLNPFYGSTLVAMRPIMFRATMQGPFEARLCGTSQQMRKVRPVPERRGG
jgi:hypothetical protein